MGVHAEIPDPEVKTAEGWTSAEPHHMMPTNGVDATFGRSEVSTAMRRGNKGCASLPRRLFVSMIGPA